MKCHASVRLAGLVIALTLNPFSIGAAMADTITCTSVCNFGSNAVLDNLNVKSGGIATLDGTLVTGNIVVEDGGALYLINDVNVEGNVQSFGGSAISVLDAVVGGSIQIKNTPRIRIDGTTMQGDLQLEENDSTVDGTSIASNMIGGNLQLYKNDFSGRVAHLSANNILGNLQLVENRGGTINVTGNHVESAAQCSDNDSQITGSGNDVGDLECMEIQSGGSSGGGGGGGGGGNGGGGGSNGGSGNFEDDTCTGVCDFGPGDTLENLYIKNGGKATLNGTRVTGNIVVEDGGALDLSNGVNVGGNVQSFGGSEISVLNAAVGGSIQVKNTPRIRIEKSTMEGDLQLEENNAKVDDTSIFSNHIGGNLQLYKNNFAGRKAHVSSNSVLGNLQLVNNKGGMILVYDNIVKSALQCGDNDSEISGCGNDVGDLECPGIDPGPCDSNARKALGGAQTADALLPAGCGAGLSGALAAMAGCALMFAKGRATSGRRR